MPESWIKYTQENLARSQHERKVSAKLRGAVDACIRACANEMWAQHNAVNNSLNARIQQLEGAKEALQAHLQRVRSTTRLSSSVIQIISPHGIAMPKGLYLTAVVFLSASSSFSMPNLLGHWTDLNLDTYSIMTAIGKICFELPGHLPSTGWGDKNRFLGPTLNFDRTYLCNGTGYRQSERNLSIYRDSPTCQQIWRTLV